jgi:hypothetical protein
VRKKCIGPHSKQAPLIFCVYTSVIKRQLSCEVCILLARREYKLESNFTTLCACAPHQCDFGPMACNILYRYLYIFCTCTLFLRVLRLVARVGRKSGHFSSAALLTVAVSFGEKRPQLLNIPTPLGFWREQIGASGGNRKRKLMAKSNNQYINTRWGMFRKS